MAKQQLNSRQSKGTTINQQSIGSNSVVGVQFQAGFDYMNSVAGQSAMSKTITFPTPFTQILGVVCYPFGTAGANASVANMQDFTTTYQNANLDTGASANLTQATFRIQLRSGVFGGTNERWGFSWLAWGII